VNPTREPLLQNVSVLHIYLKQLIIKPFKLKGNIPRPGLGLFLFKFLISLLTTKTELTIDDSNISSFIFLAESLGNSSLLKRCFNLFLSETQTFKLSSKI
jgi:hypothetical protein